MKYDGLRLVAERDVPCLECRGTGKINVVDPAPRYATDYIGPPTMQPTLEPCGRCGGSGTRVDRQQLLHDGEPFFLVRGQDQFALVAVYAYTGALLAAGASVVSPIEDGLEHRIVQWQAANPGLVKHPD